MLLLELYKDYEYTLDLKVLRRNFKDIEFRLVTPTEIAMYPLYNYRYKNLKECYRSLNILINLGYNDFAFYSDVNVIIDGIFCKFQFYKKHV